MKATGLLSLSLALALPGALALAQDTSNHASCSAHRLILAHRPSCARWWTAKP